MRRRCSTLLCLLLLALPAFGQWKTLKNDNFILFYPAGREALALDAFQALEIVRHRAEELTGNQTGRMPVVLGEMGIVPYGFTDLSFRRIHLFNYPDSTGELSYTPSWWAQVGIHEYIHYLHLVFEPCDRISWEVLYEWHRRTCTYHSVIAVQAVFMEFDE